MVRQISPQFNFNAGEITPRLYSRTDVSKYANALKTATNCTVTPHGPIHRRAGFQFINEVKDSTKETRLIKYQFSNTQSYILEFGELYIRFYKDGGVLGGPFEVTTTYTESELDALTFVQQGNIIYLCHSAHPPAKLTRNGDVDWVLEDLAFSPPPTYESGHMPSATLTPAATTGDGIAFTAGSASFLASYVGRQIINNSDGETGRGIITAYTSTTVVDVDILVDFTDTNAIDPGDWNIDLSPIAELEVDSGIAGELATVTADDIGTANAIATFLSSDVGRYILIQGGVIQITKHNSSSSVSGEVMKSLNDLTETSAWTLEEESWDGTRGYPEVAGLYQQRLLFASTAQLPTTIWFSETAIFDGFGVGPDDEDAIEVNLAGRQTNKISWLSNSRDLVIGTTGSEVTIDTGSSGALTPSSIRSNIRTFHGSNSQTPVEINNETIFIQNSNLKIRSFRYDFEIDGYTGEDLTFLAEHITADILKRVVYGQEPDRIIYAVLEDGSMLSGTYMREQQVLGWSRLITDGLFEDVQIITNGSVDEVWVIVKRTINGSDVRYIERLEEGDGTDRLHGFSDSFLTYSSFSSISGITAANPGVVTTTAAHGLSVGDDFKMLDVLGMTEVNNTTYIVGSTTSTTITLESSLARTSAVTSALKWTVSASGTDEYYVDLSGGGDPSIPSTVSGVYEDDVRMTKATVGSLTDGQWDYGDNDTLGYSTIYVRLTGAVADPDDKGQGWVEYALGVDTSAFTAYTSGGELHELIETVSGLSHLEGEVVQVKADGATHPSATVTSGAITLVRPSYELTVGMPYTTTIETLNKSFEDKEGEMQGQRVRWVRPILRVFKSTLPLLNGEFLPSRSDADEMDQSVPLYSGDLIYGSVGWDTDGGLLISTSEALPLRLSGIFGTLEGGIT